MPQEIVFTTGSRAGLAEYRDAPLAAGELRGPTLCTLISQGTELAWLAGDAGFPVRPGYGAVFRVEECGAGVTGVETGEIRFCMGAHRSSQQHAARDTLPVPAGMAAETAAIARLMAVSMATLMTTSARPGDPAVVTGAGPVGLLAAHVLAAGGLEVSVVEPDPVRRAQAEQSGIASTHAEMPLDDPALRGKVALVADCSGNEAAVLAGCRMVRQMGEVVLVGVPWRKMTDIAAHDLLREVFFNYVQLRSGWEWQLPVHSRGFVWEELLEGYNNAPHSTFSGFDRALRWLGEGRVRLDGLVRSLSPAAPQEVYRAIREREVPEPFLLLDWASLAAGA